MVREARTFLTLMNVPQTLITHSVYKRSQGHTVPNPSSGSPWYTCTRKLSVGSYNIRMGKKENIIGDEALQAPQKKSYILSISVSLA